MITSVVAILIAVFVLHRHIRSHHLRFRVRFDLLPTATFDPSPRAGCWGSVMETMDQPSVEDGVNDRWDEFVRATFRPR
ncbi:hypothetical protein [Amycolatopsis sp. WQ 127309]|uniref:hypothetical protein n=1 Tax=Amycolatopsis sp. WQ 127309 TaxID=2932773 RepID=UPI001FF59859|nr:hypothetical protein [Amycolatopsis sp. WQ 127309]UOZ07018.1 hypothetical protein MUY22_01615 [Amycolatopsis sp. WQ 127309]